MDAKYAIEVSKGSQISVSPAIEKRFSDLALRSEARVNKIACLRGFMTVLSGRDEGNRFSHEKYLLRYFSCEKRFFIKTCALQQQHTYHMLLTISQYNTFSISSLSNHFDHHTTISIIIILCPLHITNMSSKGTPSQMSSPIKGCNMNNQEFLGMVLFLEEPDNFKLLTGSAANGKGVVAGQRLSKRHAYDAMAASLNKLIKDKDHIWTPDNAKTRYESYKKRYGNANTASKQTGFGLTEKDYSRGLTTIESKLESPLCPYYDRMNALFGHRQNVTPAVIVQIGRKKPPSVITTPANGFINLQRTS